MSAFCCGDYFPASGSADSGKSIKINMQVDAIRLKIAQKIKEVGVWT